MRGTFQDLEQRLALPSAGPFFSGAEPGYGDLGLFAVVDNLHALAPGWLGREGFRAMMCTHIRECF